MKALRSPVALLVPLLLAVSPAARGGDPPEREFTLGLLQKELRAGMDQAAVAEALGSPNLVTRGADGRESWVYDKVASEVRVKGTTVTGGGGAMGPIGPAVWLGFSGARHRDERVVSTQRTLTVVIRFDAAGRVDTFAFHASRF